MDTYRSCDRSPGPNLHTDLVALTQTVLALRQRQIEVGITVHNIQTRIERGAGPHALRPLVLAVQQRNLGIDVEILNLEARLNRLGGGLAELAERQERRARKATHDAARRAQGNGLPLDREDRLTG